MVSSKRRSAVRWVAAFFGLCACLGSVLAEDDVFRLPQDRDTFFRERGITETDYLHFQKAGSYRRIVRAHMGVLTWDHGTWKQDASGVIVLRSKEQVKPVRCGPLTIAPGTVDCLKAFQPLKNDISQFLARDNRQVYPAKEIADAWQYPSPRASVMMSAVKVDKETKSVTRAQLVALLSAWSKHVAGDVAEVAHVTALAHKDKVVLVWDEHDTTFWFPDEKPKSFEEKLKRVRESLKREAETGKPQGPTLYTRIPQPEFETESRTTQPFLFYPEMNGRIRPGEPAKQD